MRKPWVPLLAIILTASSAEAQLADANAATHSKCASYLKTPLPAEAASAKAPKQWPECRSYRLYSGIGTKVDFFAARKCAWSERLAGDSGLSPNDNLSSVFAGPVILMEIYANGEGTPKDLKLALRFACEAGGAPAEIAGRLESLESLKDAPANKSKFDYCDDMTSGFLMGFCAAYGKVIQDAAETETLWKLESGWTAEQRKSFDLVLRAERAYATAVAEGEVDLSGSARAMFQIDAEQTIRTNFLAALKAFETGNLPNGNAAEARKVDVDLNRVYRKTLADTEESKAEYDGAVQPEGIRNAERAWLIYRDAWIPFAKLRYPTVSSEAWLTLFTRDRVRTIQNPYCDMDGENPGCRDYEKGPLPLP